VRRFALAAALLALAPRAGHAEGTASLTIRIENVSDAGGTLRVGVYDQSGFTAKNGVPVAYKLAGARPGTTTVTIVDIPPGAYGVKVLQDINKNGYFDYGPRLMEPAGLSNDPPMRPGPADFEASRIALVSGPNSITITLH
jgi:uncharacterized protein (DUF2141 family)